MESKPWGAEAGAEADAEAEAEAEADVTTSELCVAGAPEPAQPAASEIATRRGTLSMDLLTHHFRAPSFARRQARNEKRRAIPVLSTPSVYQTRGLAASPGHAAQSPAAGEERRDGRSEDARRIRAQRGHDRA
jgi:hypothetical protein